MESDGRTEACEIVAREVRGARTTNQRQAISGGAGGVGSSRSRGGVEPERVPGETGKGVDYIVTGGILTQLISLLRDQLGEADELIERTQQRREKLAQDLANLEQLQALIDSQETSTE